MMACMFRTNPHKIVPKIVPMMILAVPMMACAHDEIRVKRNFPCFTGIFFDGQIRRARMSGSSTRKGLPAIVPKGFRVPMIYLFHGHK
jgi:hypothetical protein